MTHSRRIAICVILLGATLPADIAAQKEPIKFNDLVRVEFPKDGYRFTLVEAAKGVKISYKIVIDREIVGVAAMPFGPSFITTPNGPSGLLPREEISGGGQFYSLIDVGLGIAPDPDYKTLKKGVYQHTFEWDGRNWQGPSDFNNPKGKAFPAGEFTLLVRFRVLVNERGKDVPYEMVAKTKLTLFEK